MELFYYKFIQLIRQNANDIKERTISKEQHVILVSPVVNSLWSSEACDMWDNWWWSVNMYACITFLQQYDYHNNALSLVEERLLVESYNWAGL